MTDVNVNTELNRDEFRTRPDHRLRRDAEPMFGGLDVAGFLVSLVMVCMPLAFGAFGL